MEFILKNGRDSKANPNLALNYAFACHFSLHMPPMALFVLSVIRYSPHLRTFSGIASNFIVGASETVSQAQIHKEN